MLILSDWPIVGRLPFRHRAFAASRSSCFASRRFPLQSHDAKEKATIGKPGGNEAASDDRLDTHCHSGTPNDLRSHLGPE